MNQSQSTSNNLSDDAVDLCKLCNIRLDMMQMRIIVNDGYICSTCFNFAFKLNDSDRRILRSMRIRT